MKSAKLLVAAAAISVILYLAVFIFFVEKPLTVGIRRDYISAKLAYAKRHAGDKKIVILAGSNGRFSHRCETIEQLAQIPCVNMSISAGHSFLWQYRSFSPFLKPGDVLYLPLEYRSSNPAPVVGQEAAYIMAYDRKALAIYDPKQLAHALFYFNLPYLLSGSGEMLLASRGVERRFSASSMTAQGDEHGHSADKAQAYRDFVDHAPVPGIGPEKYRDENYWRDVTTILEAARRAGILVVGGLPTVPADRDVPGQVVTFLRQLYTSRGHCFLELPNDSRYPRDYFYDTVYHLIEDKQIAHSAALAPHLARIAASGRCEEAGGDQVGAASPLS